MRKITIGLVIVMLCTLCVSTAALGESLSPEQQALLATLPGESTFTETEVECVKDDGTVLRGTYVMPDATDGELVPLVILSHGFNSSRNSCAKLALGFGKSGIASLRFDFGGSGESDGKSTQMSVLTEVDDLNAIIDYAKTLDGIDTNHIFLCGNSMGGFVTALTAIERQEEIAAVMLNYPAFSLPDGVRAGRLMGVTFDVNNIPKVIRPDGFPVGKPFVNDVIDMHPYEQLPLCTLDVMILHGDADDMVDIEYSYKAVEAYPSAVLHVIEGGGHGFAGEQLVEQIELSVAFVQAHLQ